MTCVSGFEVLCAKEIAIESNQVERTEEIGRQVCCGRPVPADIKKLADEVRATKAGDAESLKLASDCEAADDADEVNAVVAKVKALTATA